MQFLKRNENEYKYKCFKNRINELKNNAQDVENCECSRFTICLLETSEMIDYLFRELNIAYSAIQTLCNYYYCEDRDICENECSEECVKAHINKILHNAEMNE